MRRRWGGCGGEKLGESGEGEEGGFGFKGSLGEVIHVPPNSPLQ